MKFMGLGLALLAACFIAYSTILLKKLNNLKVHFSICIIYPTFVGIPLSTAVSLVFSQLGIVNRPEEILNDGKWTALLWQIVFLVLSCLGSLLNQLFVNIGLKYEDAAKFSIIRTSDLLFTFILQIIILNIYSNAWSIIGALLILISTILVIFYKIIDKRRGKKREESIWKRFIFYKI